MLFQATLLPGLIARICSRETTVGEVLALTVGPFAVCATPKAIALDYAAQNWAVKFMVKGTSGRMEWIVASTAIKETNKLLGNAASLALLVD